LKKYQRKQILQTSALAKVPVSDNSEARYKGTLKDIFIEINGTNFFLLDRDSLNNFFFFLFFLSDKDECQTRDLNSCVQRCDNTDGGYVCSCVDGYELDADGFTCNGKLRLQEASCATLQSFRLDE